MALLKTLEETNQNLEKSNTGFIETPTSSNSQQMKEELRRVIAKLERQDIGWIDILKAMVNIVEQQGDEQIASALEATAPHLKRNRRVLRDI